MRIGKQTIHRQSRTNDIVRWIRRHYRLLACFIVDSLAIACAYIYYSEPTYLRKSAFSPKYLDSNVFTNEWINNPYTSNPYATGISMENAIVLVSSPSFVENVVRKLRLNENYFLQEWGGKEVDLYGKSPVEVIADVPDDREFTFSIQIDSNRQQCLLSDFVLDGESLDAAEIVAPFGETIATPVGKVQIVPTLQIKNHNGKNVRFARSTAAKTAYEICRNLQVSKIAQFTDVLLCTYSDPVAQRADDLLNALPEAFNDLWRQWNNDDAQKVDNTLKIRLAEHSEELARLEKEITAVMQGNSLMSIEGETRKLLYRQTTYNDSLFAIQTRRQAADRIMAQLATETEEPIADFPGSPAVTRAVEQYNSLIMQHRQAVRAGGSDNPAASDLSRRIAAMKPAIVSAVGNYRQTLDITGRRLQAGLEETDRSIRQLAGSDRQLRQLIRDHAIVESRYMQIKNMQESGLMAVNNISEATRVIYPATGDDNPSTIPPFAILSIAFIFGGIALPGLLYALSHSLDMQIHDKSDFDGVTAPIIGEIPSYKRPPILSMLQIKLLHRLKSLTPPDIVVGEGKHDETNEAFRKLRTNLDSMDASRQNPVVITTSFNPGSGKSFVGTNLAASMVLKGEKVLIADLDVRRATLSKAINSPLSGLTTYLQDPETPIERLIIADTVMPGLSILPAGKTFLTNPAELLESENLDKLFAELRKRFDKIFVDCAPVNLVTDTDIISRIADCTLFVTRIGLLDRRMLPTLEQLHRSEKLPSMAIVINGAEQ